MIEVEHSFTKTGRQRRASYVQIVEWILEAWANIKVSTIKIGFRKSELCDDFLQSQPISSSSDDEGDPTLDILTVAPGLTEFYTQLYKDDSEGEYFDGFESN